MRKKFLFSILFVSFFISCASFTTPKLEYDIALERVERPVEAAEKYGDQKIFESEKEGYKYAFEDEMIKTFWIVSTREVFLFLTNKTDRSIRIIWDEAVYVDPDGTKQKILHYGPGFPEINIPQRPTLVIGGKSIEDSIIPADVHGSRSWWRRGKIKLLPQGKFGEDPQFALNKGKKLKDKSIQILLPIQIEGVIHEYIFVFNIKDVSLEQPRGEKSI